MAVIGVNYNGSVPVRVPDDVVQWRLVANPNDIVYVHLVRGSGRYEQRAVELRRAGGESWYEPGSLLRVEEEGSDEATVFIDWEGRFPETFEGGMGI